MKFLASSHVLASKSESAQSTWIPHISFQKQVACTTKLGLHKSPIKEKPAKLILDKEIQLTSKQKPVAHLKQTRSKQRD